MLDNELTRDCKKMLKAINLLNKDGVEYPTMKELQYIMQIPEQEIMKISKHLFDLGYVHVDYADGSSIYLIENTYIGKHYVKTRGVENIRFWIPVAISVLALVLSVASLVLQLS